jgi:HTH-type transcriptional regulator / antitoxin HigA
MTAMTLEVRAPDQPYLTLLATFPPRPIRNDAELYAAIDVIDRLIARPELTPDEQDYLVVLGSLVHAYEEAHVLMPPASGIDALRHLMEENGLTQADLAPLFGSKSNLSEILSGKRELSKRHIRALSERFGLPADVFF